MDRKRVSAMLGDALEHLVSCVLFHGRYWLGRLSGGAKNGFRPKLVSFGLTESLQLGPSALGQVNFPAQPRHTCALVCFELFEYSKRSPVSFPNIPASLGNQGFSINMVSCVLFHIGGCKSVSIVGQVGRDYPVAAPIAMDRKRVSAMLGDALEHLVSCVLFCCG